MARDYEQRIAGEFACMDFSALEKAASEGRPEKFRNLDFMVTGPFVIQTQGAFETEYLYEREKILEIDYLDGFGGERDVAPFYGLQGKNSYLGCDVATWTKGIYKWNTLLFEDEDSDVTCGGALYLTEQRNCICYAAVYIRCEGEKRAVICYENSGCRLFLNGKLIADEPYGRVKGVTNTGKLVPVTFEDGLNLLLFKLRPGYICDAVDLSMTNCSIFPVAAENSALVLTHPSKTAVFVETDAGDRQIFPCFVAAFEDSEDVKLTVDGNRTFDLGNMKKGECRLVRAELPSVGEKINVPVSIGAKKCPAAEGVFTACTDTVPKMRGEELVTTSFHFDTTYHQEQRVYAMGAIYITREILKEMRRDKNFRAIISEIDYLHPYYSIAFSDRDFLRQMFAQGNTESDCFYNQPSEMTSSGEGIVRNLVYGQLYHRDVMGRICDVYSPGDVFGHFNQLSQLAVKGGCGGVYWGKHVLGFWPSFRHVSPDGTTINHRRGDITREDAANFGLSFCGYGGSAVDYVPGYPADGDLSWMENTTPKARFALPSDIRRATDRDEADFIARGERSPFEFTSRDMSLYHAGVALTRTEMKQANRLAENLLITAEKLSVMAAMNGAEYPEKALDKAWRQLLCGQHHDSITGTNNEVSFVDLMLEYREAVELAADICDRASKYIAEHICTEEGKRAIVFFNPHTWDRTEHTEFNLKHQAPVKNIRLSLPSGEDVPCEILEQKNVGEEFETEILARARVPACGYTVCYVESDDAAEVKPKTDKGNIIENEFYRIEVDPERGGGIVSLFDKENNREIIKRNGDGPANRLVALKETHDRMETQHEFYTTGHKLLSDWEIAEVERTVGQEFSRLTVSYDLGNVVHVTQEITLQKNDRRIDFKTRLDDYRDEDDLFTVTFPVDLKGVKPVFDDRFAPQVRASSRRALSFRTHQMCMASHCAVYSANQWMDYGPSVTFELRDGEKQGSIQLGMTQLIRSADKELQDIADGLLMALTKKAIPVTPFPDRAQSVAGSQIAHFNDDLTSDTRFVLSVCGIENLYEEALAERYPEVFARLEEKAKDGVAVGYFKDCENDWQKPIDVILVKASGYEVLGNWVSDLAKELESKRRCSYDVCFGDAPGKTDDYGVGIINTGNIACSVEKGDMLNLMLFHTAEFYGNIGRTNCGKKLVPEHKSHVFTYSLLPHVGSYREAELYRRALEKNDPLFAVTDFEKSKEASLPTSYSLLKTEGNIIVTSVKAGGYPMASMKGDFGTLETRGIALRFFEADGICGGAKLKLGFDAKRALVTNLLEEDGNAAALDENEIKIPVTPHTIETLVVSPEKVETGSAKIGASREVTEPTYIRSWEHDLGSMPMGYLALCAIIDRNPKQIDETRFSVKVSVANNHVDIPVSGTAKLVLPSGWQADVWKIDYSVAPSGCLVKEVTITKPHADAKGMIRLEYEYGDQVFEDIFEVGYHNPTMSVVLEGNTISVAVINNTDQPLRGELGMVTPIETWGKMQGRNPFGDGEIGPYLQPVVLEAGSRKVYTFEVKGDTSLSFWAVAKLMVNGRIYFQGVNHRPIQPHVLWAHKFIDEIVKDKGSLKKLNALK